MKDHKVQITRTFKDLEENILREIGTKTEVFMCTKERYEYLLSKGAVKLKGIKRQQKPKIKLEENEIKITANEISLIDKNNNNKTINEEKIKEKPKKKTTKKKTKIDK